MQIVRDYIAARIAVESCGFVTPCWLWKRCTRDGYGRTNILGMRLQAHRVSYEAHAGPIPDGLELDHLCCVANCVNPAHLEPVTRDENLRRKAVRLGHTIGGKPRSAFARRYSPPSTPKPPRTACDKGHEYTAENTRFRKDGSRRCMECRKTELAANALRRRLKRAAARKVRGVGTASNDGPDTHTQDGYTRHENSRLTRVRTDFPRRFPFWDTSL